MQPEHEQRLLQIIQETLCYTAPECRIEILNQKITDLIDEIESSFCDGCLGAAP